MKKKLLALMTAFLIIFTNLPITSFADTSEAAELENKMNLLLSLDVISKIYTEEELNAHVNRNETALVAAGIMNAHSMTGGAGGSNFSDVNPLSEGADSIAFLNSTGIMVGHDGKFYPEKLITYEELIKVMTAVAGYDSYAMACGGYPTGYINAANKMDILSSVSVGMGQNVTRKDLINLAYETLMADALEINSITGDGVDYIVGRSVMAAYFDAHKIEGVVNVNSLSWLYDDSDDVSEDMMMVGDIFIKTDDTAFDSYLGLPVIAYVRENSNASDFSLLAMEIDYTLLKKVTVTAEDFIALTTDGEFSYYDGDKEKNLKISQTANVIYNDRYAAKLHDCSPSLLDVKNGFAEFIDADSDGTYETIKIKEPRIVVLEGGDPIKEQLVTTTGGVIDVSAKSHNKVYLECNGGLITPERIEPDTVAEVYESADKKLITVIMTYKQISGRVTMIGDKIIAIDGTEYSADADFISGLKLDAEGSFFLDSIGRIVGMSIGASERKHYAVVAGIKSEGGISNIYSLKLFDDTGSMKILTLNDKCTVDGTKTNADSNLYTSLTQGEYAIYRKIVRYIANEEGKIIWLDTLKPNNEYDEDELVEDYADKSMQWKSPTSIFGEGQVKIGTKTVIFAVPYEGAPEHLWYLKPLSQFVHDRNHTISVYSMNDMRIAGAVVEYETLATSGSPKYDSTWFVYEETVNKLGEDGETITVINGWSEGNQGISYIVPDYYEWEEPAFGDVFQITVNTRSEVVASRLCRKAKDDEYMRSEVIYGTAVSGYNQTFGRILRVDGTLIVVNVGSDEAPDERVYDLATAKNGYVINDDKESIRKAVAADLAPNALILIRERHKEPYEYAVIY